MNNWTRAFNSGIMALITPKKLFKENKYHESSIFASLLIIIALVIVSNFLSTSFMNRTEVRETASRIQAQPLIEQGYSEEEAYEMMNSDSIKTVQSIATLVFSFIIFSIVILAYWVFLIFVGRMLGAEETVIEVDKKGGKIARKNLSTFFISIYAVIPSLFSAIASNVLLLTKPADSFVNILNQQDLTENMAIDPSLFYLFFDVDLNPFIERIFHTISNPFTWWFCIIAYVSNSIVLKMKPKMNIILISIWLFIVITVNWSLLMLPKWLGIA